MRLLARAVAVAVALAPTTVLARPQITSGLTTGLATTDLRTNGPRLAYHLGGRLDVLFLRETPRDMAIGPYVDVASEAFDTLQAGGGAAWLFPAGETAFVLSSGAFARRSAFGWEPGMAASLFWGSRSYNYHSAYTLGVGLFVQGHYGFGDGKQADAIAGVQIDLEYFALPFVLAYEAVTR